MIKKPLTKALYTALVDHVNGRKTRPEIMKKFNLKQPNNFYRKFYFAMMQEAKEMREII